MSNIPAYFLSLKPDTPTSGYWDYGLLEELLDSFGTIDRLEARELPESHFAIVVLPARSHVGLEEWINSHLLRLERCLLFLMGDEESKFDVEKLQHPNIKIWIQNPRPVQHHGYSKLGCGYPPQIHSVDKLPEKAMDWFFAGQVTHRRREECARELKRMMKSPESLVTGDLITTAGFTEGIDQEEYYLRMAQAKVAPCPSGPETPDTFRLFEALELGCVPIADTQTPNYKLTGFWTWLFGEEPPFPTISEYESLPGYITNTAFFYPTINNKVQSWWQRTKSDYRRRIAADVYELTRTPREGPTAVAMSIEDPITVVVPISPIPSHPETDILEETIVSVRHHLPYAEIILTFDGVRPEQAGMLNRYEEHIRRVLWKARFWGNVRPYIFDTHLHQSGMFREIIGQINTPLILYIEQDTPLVTDEDINWTLVKNTITSGQLNAVRFHHEGVIPHEHDHLMMGFVGADFLRTMQWSQRPHLASRAFYRNVLDRYFTEQSRCFLEDLLHGKLIEACELDGLLGWEQWRVGIYYPDKKNIKRSYHTDGREGVQKYDETQIW